MPTQVDSDDIAASLKPETLAKLDESLLNPLRGALRTAKDSNIEDFSLEGFLHNVADSASPSVPIEGVTREMIYSAIANLSVAASPNPRRESTDGDPATEAQKRALMKFRLRPDDFPTKGEASGIISAYIDNIEKRRRTNASTSSPASPA